MSRYTLDYGILIENVKALRKAKNISQMQLSEMADLSVNTISKFEINQKQINLHTLIKICNALDVDINTLIGCAENKSRTQVDLLIDNLLEDFTDQDKELLVPVITAIRFYKKNRLA